MLTCDDPEKEVTIIHEQNCIILRIMLFVPREKGKVEQLQEDVRRTG